MYQIEKQMCLAGDHTTAEFVFVDIEKKTLIFQFESLIIT